MTRQEKQLGYRNVTFQTEKLGTIDNDKTRKYDIIVTFQTEALPTILASQSFFFFFGLLKPPNNNR